MLENYFPYVGMGWGVGVSWRDGAGERGQFRTQMNLQMFEYGEQKGIPGIVFTKRDKDLKSSQNKAQLNQ